MRNMKMTEEIAIRKGNERTLKAVKRFKKGVKEGKGTVILKNGDKFAGNYQQGSANG